MKRRNLFCSLLLMTLTISSAQVPQKFNYQAVVRDAQQGLVTNQDVGFRLSILESSADGTPVYVETHLVSTNSFGLADLVIGEGSVVSGTFTDIPWGEEIFFLKVEMDQSGGSAYEHVGTSQLISVPYALYSANLSSPTQKFTIQETEGHPVDSALFEVRNVEGQTVFAVYPEGTRIYILDEEAKGRKDGFAVGGYSRTTKGVTQEYMRVTPDSIRMYFDEESTKGKKGGFAVGGYSKQTKGLTDQYFHLEPDNASFTLVSDSPDQMLNNSLTVSNRSRADGTGDQKSLINLTMENYLIGHRAGESLTDGTDNCFIGYACGVKTTSGTSNIFIGTQSGQENLEGSGNVFLGSHTGFGFQAGSNNVFLGNCAGNYLLNGDNNVLLGSSAGNDLEEGGGNIFIGYYTGENYQHGGGNIFIGSGAGRNAKGEGKLIIDSYSRDSSEALIYGDILHGNLRINNRLGIGRNAIVHALEVEGTVSKSEAGEWMVNSDARIKTDIEDIANAKEQILKLHPVKFRYTDEWKETNPSIRDIAHYNFVAQEFQQVFPDAVQEGGDRLPGGEPVLQLDSYPAQVVAIRAIQELIEENRSQQALIDQLLQKVTALEQESVIR
jgi:hypothetical protein